MRKQAPAATTPETDSARVSCTVCSVRLLARNLSAHLRRHSARHDCAECGRAFRSPRDLRAHVELHAPLEVVCPECGVGFKSRAVFRSHRRRAHGPLQPAAAHKPCPVCAQPLHAASLAKHVRRVHAAPAAAHRCLVCGKTFASAEYLRRHSQLHDDERRFRCLHCDGRFQTRRSLGVHAKRCASAPSHSPRLSDDYSVYPVYPSFSPLQLGASMPSPLLIYSPASP